MYLPIVGVPIDLFVIVVNESGSKLRLLAMLTGGICVASIAKLSDSKAAALQKT